MYVGEMETRKSPLIAALMGSGATRPPPSPQPRRVISTQPRSGVHRVRIAQQCLIPAIPRTQRGAAHLVRDDMALDSGSQGGTMGKARQQHQRRASTPPFRVRRARGATPPPPPVGTLRRPPLFIISGPSELGEALRGE